MENNDKKIDESWKEKAERDKHIFSQQGDKTSEHLIADFKFFITGIGIQAMMAMGEVENPATNKKEEDLTQAKYLIDILGMLKEKTKNNLETQEANLLDELLYQLRTIYVRKVSNKK